MKTSKENNNPRIFISYSWNNKDVADQIEKDLSQLQIGLAEGVRDLEYKSNYYEFMEEIRVADSAYLLIRDDYLKPKKRHELSASYFKGKIL